MTFLRTLPTPLMIPAVVVAAVVVSLSCGGDTTAPDPDPPEPDNVAPSLGAIGEQTVIRNSIEPRSVEIPLQIDDPDDDDFTVTVTSGDEATIAGTTLQCGTGPCLLTLTPSPAATTVTTLSLTVSDDSGGEATRSFDLKVLPRLVTTTGDDGAGSLRRAVSSAEPGDVVGFDTDGAFAGPATIALLGSIVIDRDLTIEGPGADVLTLSGNNSVRVLVVTSQSEVLIRGVTVADGRASPEQIVVGDTVIFRAWGGGILVEEASRLTLAASRVSENDAHGDGAGGGGIANVEATLILIDDSRVLDNSAPVAGGILIVGYLSVAGAVASIENGIVSGNSATSTNGGGIYNLGGAVIVHGSSVVGNTAARSGGGVFSDLSVGSVIIRAGSVVAENSAAGSFQDGAGGGGIDNDEGTTTISASTVEANISAGSGGGIRNGESATLIVEDGSSVLGNVADGLGGGIYNDGNLVLGAGSSVTGNTAHGPPPSGGGLYDLGTRSGSGEIAENTPDDVAP